MPWQAVAAALPLLAAMAATLVAALTPHHQAVAMNRFQTTQMIQRQAAAVMNQFLTTLIQLQAEEVVVTSQSLMAIEEIEN